MAKQFTKADMKDEVQPAKYAEELCEELVRVFEHCEGVKFNNRYIVISVENGKIASCSAYKGEIKLESMGEPDMKNENDWYEKGELPPVGAVVEAMPNWNRVEIVARHEGKCVFFFTSNHLPSIIEPIQDRCTIFNFGRIGEAEINGTLKELY